LQGYDYSREGLYFITICVKDRECLLGKIENKKMILNDLGMKADEYWKNIPNHFPNVLLHNHIIMPNHVHGIIELTVTSVMGAASRRDITCDVPMDESVIPVRTRHVVSLQKQQNPIGNAFGKPISGSVSVIIQQFKSSVKKWCSSNEHNYFQWQSRFYDHIIRDEESYYKIIEYIINNPLNWKDDTFYNE
jgi:REP element-mobilizing transposase RayT